MMSAAVASLAPAVPRARRSRGSSRVRRGPMVVRASDDSNGLGLLTWAGAVIPQGAIVTGVKGIWRAQWQTMVTELAPQSKEGEYVRPKYAFDEVIGNDINAKHPPTKNRYVLYVGNACPWCHRVTLTIALRGLQNDIQIGKLTDDAERASRGGWVFETQNPDPVFRGKDLREVYDALSKHSKGEGYKGRCTAPLLVDAELKTPVNNESADICLMLNSVNFDGARSKGSDTVDRQAVDLRPAHLLTEIDDLNEYIYKKLNNGTYRAGFATTQAAHNKAAVDVVDALELMNHKLAGNRFLLGDKVTESDVRLFPTIVRFDTVYASLFKCGSRKVSDLPNLRAWMLDFYNLPGVAKTVDVDGYRSSYFGQLFPLNPGGIVPIGPTAKDLGLGTDPGRGSVDREDVFHLKE